MHTDNKQKQLLKKNLETEMKSILFYLDNLDSLNYIGNKKKIDTLIHGSLKHAGIITRQILSLGGQGKFSKNAQMRAIREEAGMKELYSYEARTSDRPSLRRAFKQLMKEEAAHEKIVRSLR